LLEKLEEKRTDHSETLTDLHESENKYNDLAARYEALKAKHQTLLDADLRHADFIRTFDVEQENPTTAPAEGPDHVAKPTEKDVNADHNGDGDDESDGLDRTRLLEPAAI